MWVGPDHIFADHSPIYFKFAIPQHRQNTVNLYVPEDWSVFPLDSTVFHQQYRYHAMRNKIHHVIESTTTSARKFEIWWQTVEKAVDSTLRVIVMHSQDPIRCPQKNLPPKFWGICKAPLDFSWSKGQKWGIDIPVSQGPRTKNNAWTPLSGHVWSKTYPGIQRPYTPFVNGWHGLSSGQGIIWTNHEAEILVQEGRLLKIQTTACDIPTRGQLHQAQYTEDII